VERPKNILNPSAPPAGPNSSRSFKIGKQAGVRVAHFSQGARVFVGDALFFLGKACEAIPSKSPLRVARACYRKSISIAVHPDRWRPLYRLGQVCSKLGDHRRAFFAYVLLAKRRPEWVRLHLLAGQSLVAAGHAERSIPFLQKAARLHSGDLRTVTEVLATLEMASSKITESRKLRFAALHASVRQQAAELQSLKYALDARDAEKDGDPAAAEASYRNAIKLQPDTALFHYRLGLLLQRQSKWEEAESRLTRAVNAEPDNLQFVTALARTHQHLKQWDRCVRLLRRHERKLDTSFRSASFWCYCTALYRSDSASAALSRIYGHLVKYLQSDDFDVSYAYGVCTGFDDANTNRTFVDALSCTLDLTGDQGVAFTALSLCLGIQSQALLGSIQSARAPNAKKLRQLLENKWITVINEITSVPTTSLCHTSHAALVIIDKAVDLRALLDCVFSAKHALILAPNDILPLLSDMMTFCADRITLRALTTDSLQVNSQEDIRAARFCAAASDAILKEAARATRGSVLEEHISSNHDALNLAFEDNIYRALRNCVSATQSLGDTVVEHVFIIYSSLKSLRSSIRYAFPFIGDRLLYCIHAPARSNSSKLTPFSPDHQNSDSTADNSLRLFIKQNTRPLALLRDDAVLFVGNFNKCFRTRDIVGPAVKAVLQRSSCIFLNQTPNAPSDLQKTLTHLQQTAELRRDRPSTCAAASAYQCIYDTASYADNPWIEHYLASVLDSDICDRFWNADNATFDSQVSRRILRLCTADFFRQEVLPLILLTACLQNTITECAPRCIFFLQTDRYPLAYSLAKIAKQSTIPTFVYIFYFHSTHPRYKPPKADMVLVPDTFFANFYTEHFNVGPERIILVGSHVVENTLSAARGLTLSRVPRHERLRVCFATQHSIMPLCLDALNLLIQASIGLPVDIVIRPHPLDMGSVSRYESLIDSVTDGDRISIDTQSDTVALLIECDVLATLFSNIGIEAAALHKHVLSIKVGAADYPVDLEKVGVSLSVASATDLRRYLSDLINNGPLKRKSRRQREEYFARNPQMISGSVAERIAGALT
jgi:tetratricopeptide (TPR) repeat protein